MSNPYDPYVLEARARYRTATAFRIGYLIGDAGDTLPSPYKEGTRGNSSYLAGIKAGKEERERRLSRPENERT